MRPQQDISQLIMDRLNQSNTPMEAEYLAYLTGSSIRQVMQAAQRLRELELVEINEMLISLKALSGPKFSSWESLKK